MTLRFNDLSNISFDKNIYEELSKSSDNTTANTQEKSNVTYDNFLLHSSKEWLSTIESTSSELIKGVKETSDKIKADNKVLTAVKKAAPNSESFKDVEIKLSEGVKDLSISVDAASNIQTYSGALNFISTTSVNTITGSINNTSDIAITNKGPSITNTSKVVVNNSSTSINYSDTDFNKTGNKIVVGENEVKSFTNKTSVITEEISLNAGSSKTTAVKDHQIIANEQNQYSNSFTNLAAESIVIGSKGTANLISQSKLTIGAGQTLKSAESGASSNADSPIETPTILEILSNGDITTKATNSVISASDTHGIAVNKYGLSSIDTSMNSTTTTINSKTQSVLTSEGITYTGNRNMGISINPFGILAGTGVAPLIPFLVEALPPIIIDIPELPEFPFGNLADFLSKCLPFTSPIDLGNLETGTVIDEQLDISLEDTLISSNLGGGEEEAPLISLEDRIVEQSKEQIDEPLDIGLEDPLLPIDKTKEPPVPKGINTQTTNRDITTTPTTKTDPKAKESTYTGKNVAINSAKLGIFSKTLLNTPDQIGDKTVPTLSPSDIAGVQPKMSIQESIYSITQLQKSEVIRSFSLAQRQVINDNYSEFIKAVAIIDVFGQPKETLTEYSKIVNDFISNNKLVEEIKTFLATKRPIGTGGQQPINIQKNVMSPSTTPNLKVKTPPVQGQGILDILTTQNIPLQSPNLIASTSENWLRAEDINDAVSTFGDELSDNLNLSSISELLNNQYVNQLKGLIPDSKIQSALSLTQDIANGNIKTPEQYANRLANLIGGDVVGYISYAEQAFSIYKNVENGDYTSLLNIPGASNVLGSQGTAIATKVLNLISKKNITDKDIYELAGSIFTSLTGIGIPLLDELAKLLGCIDSLKQDNPTLQDIPNSNLQDIIDYLPRIIQTTKDKKVLNITPSNCGQVSTLSAEEATINVTEIGQNYITFKLQNKDLITFNSNPLPDINTPVNLYCEYYTDRITNQVLAPYKFSSQFTSNIIEYKITSNINNTYKAVMSNSSIILTLEDVITGALYQYTSNDIGNRLIPYILDSYLLL